MRIASRRQALFLVVLVAPVYLLTTARPGPADEAGPKTAPRKALRLPGRIGAAAQVQLYARTIGFVRQVHVDLGDRVKQGQVLAEVALPEVEAELKQKLALAARAEAAVQHARHGVQASAATLAMAHADVRQAQADVRQAQKHFELAQELNERYKKLTKRSVVTPDVQAEKASQVEVARAAVEQAEAKVLSAKAATELAAANRGSAEAAVKVAEAALQAAQAGVQRVQARLGFARVVAPFDGVVTRRGATVGALAGVPTPRAAPLFTVTQIDPVRVGVDVPEADAARVRAGAAAVVEVAALRGRKFTGKVARTAGILDPRTGTMRVEIDLPNRDGRLFPGMNAVVTLTLSQD